MSKRLLLPALLAATLFAAGCGGAGESSEPVAATEVEMVKSYRFDPKTIEIEAGDTVTWKNEEDHKVGQGESVEIPSTSPALTTTSARCTARTWTARIVK